jgi:hypothetical protein
MTFNFDMDKITKSINSGTISFPRKGMTGQERIDWIRLKLKELDAQTSPSL